MGGSTHRDSVPRLRFPLDDNLIKLFNSLSRGMRGGFVRVTLLFLSNSI